MPDDPSQTAPAHKPCILIVEDSVTNREVASVFLDAAG